MIRKERFEGGGASKVLILEMWPPGKGKSKGSVELWIYPRSGTIKEREAIANRIARAMAKEDWAT